MKELFEQLRASLGYIAEAILSESTLTKLVGKDVAGMNLARYVHDQFRVADSATWVKHPEPEKIWLDAIKNAYTLRPDARGDIDAVAVRGFGSVADNMVLYKGPRGWAFVKRTEEQRFGSGQMWEYYLSMSPIPADIAAEKDALEKNRDMKYGVKRMDSRIGAERVRDNRIYDIPFIERGTRIVKKRTTKPKEMLADIKQQLEGLTAAWTATERETEDPKLGKAQEQWYRDQLIKAGLDPDDLKYWSMTSDQRKKFDAIRRSFPKLHSGGVLGKNDTGAGIEADKIASRGEKKISHYNANAIYNRISDVPHSEDIAVASVDVYKLAFRRALVRLDRMDASEQSIKTAELRYDSHFGEDDSIAVQEWRREYIDPLLRTLAKGKTAKGQQQYKELTTRPNGTVAKKILLDYALKKLMKEFG